AELTALGAAQAADLIAAGRLGAEELTRACLARIEAREAEIGAWAFLDPDHALQQARRADEARRLGRPLGPLHGVPVGLKDIFDTRDMPTEYGSVLHAGRQPREDATAVARLRAAGAVILGKTVATEFAVYTPGKTRNPVAPEHTPGGSSSGSAAAVADGMVPLALGSQTNGSIVRPAAFCGVLGYKPSFGLVSRHGVLHQSRLLDHVGGLARTLEDLALLIEVLAGHDGYDLDVPPRAQMPLQATLRQDPPVRPRLAFVPTPVWEQAEPDTREAFAELVEVLGEDIETVDLPAPFGAALDIHRTLHEVDLAVALAREYERGRDQLSPALLEMLERGRRTTAFDYHQAVAHRTQYLSLLDRLCGDYDALLTPSVPGSAPRGLEQTGSPAFCTLWTLCGLPALNLPLLADSAGLPLGVQLVGAPHDDARFLRTGRWLLARCSDDSTGDAS
ncbi:MAG: amidase, partial [Candidatus Competibacterales bacterium]|nr:amidase [Candidatus Competibacterales bacterium]